MPREKTSAESQLADRSQRLEQVISNYLLDVDAGKVIDVRGLISKHPDLQPDLEDFLNAGASLERIVGNALHLLPSSTDAKLHASTSEGSDGGVRGGSGRALTDAPAKTPTHFDRYEVLREHGSGGFGTVFLARDPELQRDVIIKVPRADILYPSEAAADRFLAEARTVAQLKHSGIVNVFDVGRTDDGHCFIVMEYVDGLPLSDIMLRQKLTPVRCAELLVQVATSMHFAHERGFVHGDLKPSNILVTADWHARVTDFGLAVRIATESPENFAISGTPNYMSPEQVRGESHRFDGRTDIWSLGVVFYALLVGKQPFNGKVREVFDAILSQDPQPMRQIDCTIAPQLEFICSRCLSKQMSDRYATALDLADDLRAWLAESTPRTDLQADGAPDARPTETTKVIPRGLRSFDGRDTDFFLRLLPGPRDRMGVPVCVGFWKNLIEETDGDQTFSVGLLYGPSGCGKSSLVKAGLLPRLSSQVVPIYIECNRTDTEQRLLTSLAKHYSALADEQSIAAAIGALRTAGRRIDEPHAEDQKTLIVLDQFEQWLHWTTDSADRARLISALRQADGAGVQFLLMIRDDFWMGVSRLFRELDIPIVEGTNAAHIDVFDQRHARRVLVYFGQAYGALPEGTSLTDDANRFLDRAISYLAENWRVSPIRLALFAEMVNGRSWTTATLDEMGGAEGVGLAFLDQCFNSASANPHHRSHFRAARAVLHTLLPEVGTEIKDQIRSGLELLEASGYKNQLADFADLMRILDAELRLVTPVDPQGTAETACEEGTLGEDAVIATSSRHYQLTHDFLVSALRAWLTREDSRTWRGRVRLGLEEQTALWEPKQDSRYLPNPIEYASILLAAPRRSRLPAQQRFINAAHRRFASWFAMAIALTGLIGWGGWELHGHMRAEGLTRAIGNASIEQVPALVEQLQPYRRWSEQGLRRLFHDGTAAQQRNAALALLTREPKSVEATRIRLLHASVSELPILRDALRGHVADVSNGLWQKVEDPALDPEHRFNALVALADMDPKSPLWEQERYQFIVDRLLEANVDEQAAYRSALWPIRHHLVDPIMAHATNVESDQTLRLMATHAIADFAADHVALLVDALVQSDEQQFPILIKAIASHHVEAVRLLKQELDTPWQDEPDQPSKDASAKRQAKASISLLVLGEQAGAWGILRHDGDPRARTYWIDLAGRSRLDPAVLADKFCATGDAQEQFALMLALGGYAEPLVAVQPVQANGAAAVPRDDAGWYQNMIDRAANIYHESPRRDLHAASGWLLRRIGQQQILRQVDQELATKTNAVLSEQVDGRREWFINEKGMTMVKIPPGSFVAGANKSDGLRQMNESQVEVTVDRSLWFADREIPIPLFDQFYREAIGWRYPFVSNQLGPRADSGPVLCLTWYEAMAFCRWLSDKEGIDPERNCYPSLEEILAVNKKTGSGADLPLELPDDVLDRPGYRLPTESEWEYACRAGTKTRFGFGNDTLMLDGYGWYIGNARRGQITQRTWPGGSLKPNDWGLFDMHGNAAEWCLLGYEKRPGFNWSNFRNPSRLDRVVKGGGWYARDLVCRSAFRVEMTPSTRLFYLGFRVVLNDVE